MATFNIYKRGEGKDGQRIEAQDKRAALEQFSAEHDLGPVRRDGAGILYVGNGAVGRFAAELVIDPAKLAEWRAKCTHGQPFGMPEVLAGAIQQVGGLR